MRNTKEFKSVLNAKPNSILGKKGITKEYLTHIEQLLKRDKIIKIKVLKVATSLQPIKDLAVRIAKETESNLLDVRGKTIIVSKR